MRLDPGSGSAHFTRPTRRRTRAFSLVELLLTLVLMLTLAGLSILSLMALRGGRDLDEAPAAVEGVVRLARAEAANLGRRVRLVADPLTGGLQVLWEPKPLAEPGTFVPYVASSWVQDLTFGSTQVVRCQVVDPDVPLPSGVDPDSDDPSAAAGITFAPDGTCDSAEIELISRDVADERRALISIDGLSGLIDARVQTPIEIEEAAAAAGPVSRLDAACGGPGHA